MLLWGSNRAEILILEDMYDTLLFIDCTLNGRPTKLRKALRRSLVRLVFFFQREQLSSVSEYRSHVTPGCRHFLFFARCVLGFEDRSPIFRFDH